MGTRVREYVTSQYLMISGGGDVTVTLGFFALCYEPLQGGGGPKFANLALRNVWTAPNEILLISEECQFRSFHRLVEQLSTICGSGVIAILIFFSKPGARI